MSDEEQIDRENRHLSMQNVHVMQENHELRQKLDALTLRWTSEKPTVEGWWWYREGQTESVMQITNGHDGILYGWLHENVYPLHVYHGEWSDRPIGLPEEG